MKRTRSLYVCMLIVGIASVLALMPSRLSSQQSAAVRIDNDDIGGVVTSAKGPEAGVWVIAETTDLPTRFARMVVTDDQGRYVVPDLPKATTTSGCVVMGWLIRRRSKPLQARS